jgi:murein peptide amidase A
MSNMPRVRRKSFNSEISIMSTSHIFRDHSYSALCDEWEKLEESNALSLRRFSLGKNRPDLLRASIGPERKRRVLITAGTHGDEPATPWALLNLVQSGSLDARFGYDIWCCINPSGYEKGTRQNLRGIDINRSFGKHGSTEAEIIASTIDASSYELVLDLHEDFEAQGFYLYEYAAGKNASLGSGVVTAIGEAGYPLQALDDTFDLGYSQVSVRSLCKLERGRVTPYLERELEYFQDAMPLGVFTMRSGKTPRCLTFESPRSAPLPARLHMHQVAISHALKELP